MLRRGEIDMLLSTWEQWQQDAHIMASLTPFTIQLVITAYTVNGQPDEALNLLQNPETRAVSAPAPIWLMDLLRKFIRRHYAEGALYLLIKVMDAKVLPDEGTCIEGLNAAARCGHSKLATQFIKALDKLKVKLAEWHFIPIIQAYLKSSFDHDWRQGVHVACRMYDAGISLQPHSLSPPLVDHFANNSSFAHGFERTLKELCHPHILLWNILIEAYIKSAQIDMALNLFRYVCDADSSKVIPNLIPDSFTFDMMLKGAVDLGLFKVSAQIEIAMAQHGIPLTLSSYTFLIQAALANKKGYIRAFLYLEVMKDKNITPTYEIYSAIITRCAQENDLRAANLALEEMEQFGYSANSTLRRLIETGGMVQPKNLDSKDDQSFNTQHLLSSHSSYE
ncbi:DNA-dependent ATPase mgs1 [Massospora cicadina]|nr:DNA-dependent ATPase mgs1 [Massospora cicadina]